MGTATIYIIATIVFFAFLFFGRQIVQFPIFLYWILWDSIFGKKRITYGIFMYTGIGGVGKTTCMTYDILKEKQKYPKAWVYTNYGLSWQTGVLHSWEQIRDLDNGDDGIIFGIDEGHEIFNKNDWMAGKIPPSILKVFGQNRKMAKSLFFTSQSFGDCLVDLRRRTRFVYECHNIGDRWFFKSAYRWYQFKDDGTDEWRAKRKLFSFSFVANNKFFAMYPSFMIIDSIRDGTATEKLQNETKKATRQIGTPQYAPHVQR